LRAYNSTSMSIDVIPVAAGPHQLNFQTTGPST
jgi:hypothetical protein